MADIVFKYDEMRAAVKQIQDLAARYKSASDTLGNEFLSAIQGWEGESKDAMQKFMTGPVAQYTGVTVPQLLNAMADLLAANADQMEKADGQIAENIPSSLG